ncbi:hypothetical protein QC762_605805 [Podospora pseudocomata]|uniref:Uncharacterized protein n=1 Tax=Podospora pseudocomata TaxID=2093779 RepID=A0ABR0G6Q8_9PEZI|nr:hypothetical protein QC762_605805 [Podospora pseudocomata]
MHDLESSPAIDDDLLLLLLLSTRAITRYDSPSPLRSTSFWPTTPQPSRVSHQQRQPQPHNRPEMPTYLTHAFPFPRPLIRIFTVLHDLSDCSPEHLISPSSSHSFLSCLRNTYPFIPPPDSPPDTPPSGFDVLASQSCSPVKVLEAYNPGDLSSAFTPFAYIADFAVRIDDVVDITAITSQYLESDWFPKLRDELMKIGGGVVEAGGEGGGGVEAGRVGWYVVVNGDEERGFPGEEEGKGSDGEEEEERRSFKLEEELLGKRRDVQGQDVQQ